ncbi:hypothetical protein Godav_001030 [Gossypium davidsonii]|uniref:Uncharacterized protein n=1 Tax=Gossypium davidsonii TaxID=34287 RepID=A0A7J8T1M3_GOSDV|nr:hypothetical protein [Gossypium davidsonii]
MFIYLVRRLDFGDVHKKLKRRCTRGCLWTLVRCRFFYTRLACSGD